MPFLPLHDANPRLYIRAHYVTIGLILLNAAIFWNTLSGVQSGIDNTLIGYALIPARLLSDAQLPVDWPGVSSTLTLVSYQFLHGGWQHLIFNMLFLWVFGDNVEDAMGHSRFIAFFLICGIAGGLVHSFIDPNSLTPTIGASGAIAAFGFIPLRLPALLVIGAFFAQDVLWGITGAAAVQGVAVFAHIGGFITGMILVILFKRAHIPLWHRPPGPWN
jgi:membrane associated rhomboid family serine protease